MTSPKAKKMRPRLQYEKFCEENPHFWRGCPGCFSTWKALTIPPHKGKGKR